MSASATDLHRWIEDFHESVAAQLDEIHPMAAGSCREYFGEMHDAVAVSNMAELARLVRLTRDKIADELEWEEDKERSAADPAYVPRCLRD